MSTQQTQKIMVSTEFMKLRGAFATLNRTLWSSELAYGYVLVDPARDFSNPNRQTRDALAKVTGSQVWYPNRAGKIRYNEKVSEFLDRIRANTSFMYRSVIVFAIASFEEYLKARVGRRPPTGKSWQSWGPYLVSLSPLVHDERSVQLETLLCADFCRELRNQIAHEPSVQMPTTVGAGVIDGWKQILAKLNAPLA